MQTGLEPLGAFPVFVPGQVLENFVHYYDHVITPLFHNLVSYRNNYELGNPKYILAYRSLNKIFAETILALSRKDPLAMIMLNDPHFLLVPKMITESEQKTPKHLGYFFHSPFPSRDIFRMIPFALEVRINIATVW